MVIQTQQMENNIKLIEKQIFPKAEYEILRKIQNKRQMSYQ